METLRLIFWLTNVTCYRSIEPSLAKKIALGDVCPITLLGMEDINPTFAPRALKSLVMNAMSPTKSDAKGKGRARAHFPEKSRSTTSILQFFSEQYSLNFLRKPLYSDSVIVISLSISLLFCSTKIRVSHSQEEPVPASP